MVVTSFYFYDMRIESSETIVMRRFQPRRDVSSFICWDFPAKLISLLMRHGILVAFS